MTPAQQYLQAIGWQGTEEDFYRSNTTQGSTWPRLPEQEAAASAAQPAAAPSATQVGASSGQRMAGQPDPDNPDEVAQYLDDYWRSGKFSGGGWYKGDPGAYAFAEATGGYNAAAAAAEARRWLAENPEPLVKGKKPIKITDAMKTDAAGRARGGIEDAFRSYGISDVSPYSADIESRLAATIAGIPTGTTDLDKYFTDQNLGSKLISDLEPAYRNKAKADFNTAVPTDFFSDTADDALIAQILGEDRAAADEFVNNMLARGQIMETGVDAARNDLTRQAGLGSTRLNEIGAGLMNTQEGNLATQRGGMLTGYDTLKLGQAYDVPGQAASLNKIASDFLAGMAPQLRSGLGSTPLFSTSGLGAIGGAAQGGQNTTFGTGAQQPPVEGEEEEEPTEQDVLF